MESSSCQMSKGIVAEVIVKPEMARNGIHRPKGELIGTFKFLLDVQDNKFFFLACLILNRNLSRICGNFQGSYIDLLCPFTLWLIVGICPLRVEGAREIREQHVHPASAI